MGAAVSQPASTKTSTFAVIISENQDYNTGVLTTNALIDYKLSIVNNGPKQYLIHASSGTTTLSKLNMQLSELPSPIDRSIQVELDLYVNSGGEKVHFATISEDSELAKSFIDNVGDEYPYIFATWGVDKKTREEGPINPVNIYLIDEVAMKNAISDNGGGNWADQQIDIVDVQDRVSELEGIIKSAQNKLQSYKKSSTESALKGLGIEQSETTFANNGIPIEVEDLYKLYTKLATYTTLTGDVRTKSNLIANIYKNYTILIDMMGGAKAGGGAVEADTKVTA
jgi:hypothetical protein